ncbi:hypothetical protein Q3G72_001294 [Acer saccharum]|nr:hypothetical protein Q3G72_001294 [Acer saccharum]
MSISHKLADAATAAFAMRCWAVTTFGSTDAAEAVVPLYNSAEIFPPRRFSAAGVPPLVDFKKEKLPIKRLVFEASKVAALKALAVSDSVEQPTRAESVTALIWKCALNVARSNSGVSRPSILTRAVNIRRKIEPPLPDNSVGNLVWFYTAEKDESETELKGLVREIRDKLKVFDKNYLKMLQQEDTFKAMTDISHKLADAATAAFAMRCWAVTTFGSTDAAEAVVPLYNSAETFPPRRFSAAGVPPLVDFKKEKLPIKRLVFEASKVAALKALAVSESVEQPTRAESVTALIWKCALNVARSNSGVSRPSILTRAVNIRRKIEPPLPDNSVGNLVWFYTAEKDESETELKGLVREIRDKLKVLDKNYLKMLQQEDTFKAMTEPKVAKSGSRRLKMDLGNLND